jgi:polysaccharide pyruvyl transferase WcaK-like protein
MRSPNIVARLKAIAARSIRTRSRRSGEPDLPSDAFTTPIRPVAPSSPPGPTIVLLNDCRDQINYGANALVDGLIAILFERVPNATIVPIPSHWLIDPAGGFGAFVNNGAGLRQPRATFPTVADQFEAVADAWLEGRGGPGAQVFLSPLDGADVVVLNGEGSIYRTNLSAIRELFLAWLAKERLGIPTVFVNGSSHLTDVMPVLPAMVRKTFPRLDAVAVREAPSLRNLEEYVPGIAAQLFPDSAFFFTPDDARATHAVQVIREQVGADPYFCFDPGTMPMDDRAHEGSALHQMISRLKRVAPRAVFVASGPADRYIERIARETNSMYVDDLVDYREWMALVADAQFLVTGRYHNAILAAIVGCPSIAFGSTSHKVHGACEMLDGLVGSPYDGTDLRPRLDAIEDQARLYADRRADLRDQLQEVCARRHSEVLELGGLVANALRPQTRGPIDVNTGTTDA